jgi:hypothetical protein
MALRALQMAKLRRLVWHCFLHVPYYAQSLHAALSPSEIEQLEETGRLPIVTAEARRQRTPFIATQAERSEAEVAERRQAVRLCAEEWAGAPPARVVAVWGREALEAPRPLSATEIAAVQVALGRAGRAVITGPGDALGELATALPNRPRKSFARRVRVDAVIARDGDLSGGATRLAAKLDARLHKWWTARELGLLAAPCELGPLHLLADQVIVDVVDGEGRPLEAGVIGRLIVTDLHKYTEPYLRYDSGRRGRILVEPCLCGRRLPLVELH